MLCVLILAVSTTLSARQLNETIKTAQGRQIDRIENNDVNFQLPRFIFNYTNTRVVIKFLNPNHSKLRENNYELNFIVNGADQKIIFDANGVGNFYYTFKNNVNTLQILSEDLNYTVQPNIISIWYIISPLLGLLLFFMYRIITSAKKNKTPKLVVKHSIVADRDHSLTNFTSTLKVVSVKEREEVF